VKIGTHEICIAAISALFSQPVEKISAEVKLNKYILSYVRDDDKTFWDYKCRIEKDVVLWGSPDGRWRTHELDETVKFKVIDDNLFIDIIYSDGSSQEYSFSNSRF